MASRYFRSGRLECIVVKTKKFLAIPNIIRFVFNFTLGTIRVLIVTLTQVIAYKNDIDALNETEYKCWQFTNNITCLRI